MIAIRITAKIIEELIEKGYLIVSLPNGDSVTDATVKRMWIDQDVGTTGTLSVVLSNEQMPPLAKNTHIPYADCEVLGWLYFNND